MPWPSHVLNSFSPVLEQDETEKESDYYAPYNTLLAYLFPPADHFMVVIAYEDPSEPGTFVVRRYGHPVFFIQIQPPGHLNNCAKLVEADREMRKEFKRLSPNLNIPTLHALSAVGTKICLYTYNTESGTITPEAIETETGSGEGKGVADRWDADVMEPEGEQRILAAVNDVKKTIDRA
ncbi:hypothetical protein LshimejAT787_1002470 [Lyophyllum shimeji]|uniref:Uncharacterized protein n=1 Tax=Lyophyllum shimeji TaxID=47721 RepID=A0A9P3PRY1_LYOSH|nr:hypothetical protein LshimejAT787_1002470 [Lyophyllum shimeji]